MMGTNSSNYSPPNQDNYEGVEMAINEFSKICRDCHKEKPLNEFGKKKRGILGVNPYCNICRAESRRKRYIEDEEHRKRMLDQQKIYHKKNPEKNRARAKAWALQNPEKSAIKKREFRLQDPERYKKYREKWKRNNKHLIAYFVADRAAKRIQASPSWRNNFIIKEIFDLARLRTAKTGIDWHVDHIVPLRSKLVCGLHCEQNMQIIPAKLNKIKSNLYWPDMP